MTGRLARYAAAAVLIRVADEGARVALTLLALQRTGSPAIGGGLVAALLVPHVVAAPLIGLGTDRARRPHLLVAATTALFAVSLLATAAGLGRAPLPVVVAVLLVGGCCGPAVTGALSSQLPALVDAAALPRAFGLDALTYNTAGIVGPALAGVLAGVLSPAGGARVLAGSALAGSVLVALLPVRHRAAAAGRGDLLAGARVVIGDRLLGTATGATSLAQLGIGALPVIAAVIAVRQHQPALSGLLLTAMAAGALVGSVLWTARPAPTRYLPAVAMGGLIGTGAALALAAAATGPVAIGAVFAVAGFFTGPVFGAVFVIRSNQSPPAVRSQVFTVAAGVKISANAAGAALAGATAAAPVALQLGLAGCFPVLAGALGTAVLRAGRRHRPARPEPDRAAVSGSR